MQAVRRSKHEAYFLESADFFVRVSPLKFLQVYFTTKFGFADEFSQNVYNRAMEEFSSKHKGWDKKYNVKEVRTNSAVNFILV